MEMTDSQRGKPVNPTRTPLRAWNRPRVSPVGTIGEVLKSGTQKTTQTGDQFEAGKPVVEK
jgi:hypothetical protein